MTQVHDNFKQAIPKFKHTYVFWGFFFLNFLALALSGLGMKDALASEWYAHMQKAPWTPPPWFFGVAWGTIMTLFAVYLTKLMEKKSFKSKNMGLYALILSLCVMWNFVFFAWQMAILGVIVLVSLAVCVSAMAWTNYRIQRGWSWLLAPFIVWGCVATSLNVYSVLYN